MQERFEQLSEKLDTYTSAAKYILTRYLTRKSRDIINISDIYKQRGDIDQYENCLDICGVIEDTLMVKIYEDPLAPAKLKVRAAKYIENYKRETYDEASSSPQK